MSRNSSNDQVHRGTGGERVAASRLGNFVLIWHRQFFKVKIGLIKVWHVLIDIYMKKDEKNHDLSWKNFVRKV